MNAIKNKKIAIVGGGPGGLTLARLLQMHQVDVKVYERDLHSEARPKGATLDLHESSGLSALEAAGLMDAFTANYRPGADKLRIADKHAKIAFDDEDTDTAISKGDFRPEIDRGPLQKILLDSLDPGTVVWDSHFINMLPEGDGWKLEFKNGTVETADIVIAADGANSKIRPYLTPIRPLYSGHTIIEGAVYDSANKIPGIHQLLNGGKLFVLSDNKSLILSSKGDGSLVFYTGCNKPENWVQQSGIDFTDKQQVTDWFKNEYSGWDEIWLELFEHAAYAFVPRPQYCIPFNQEWTTLANLTMLGDAAHVMPPYAGEGVNMAMLDALELSQSLLNPDFKDSRSAIAAYETQMRSRTAEVAMITMESTAALHGPDAISYMLNIIS